MDAPFCPLIQGVRPKTYDYCYQSMKIEVLIFFSIEDKIYIEFESLY